MRNWQWAWNTYVEGGEEQCDQISINFKNDSHTTKTKLL